MGFMSIIGGIKSAVNKVGKAIWGDDGETAVIQTDDGDVELSVRRRADSSDLFDIGNPWLWGAAAVALLLILK